MLCPQVSEVPRGALAAQGAGGAASWGAGRAPRVLLALILGGVSLLTSITTSHYGLGVFLVIRCGCLILARRTMARLPREDGLHQALAARLPADSRERRWRKLYTRQVGDRCTQAVRARAGRRETEEGG